MIIVPPFFSPACLNRPRHAWPPKSFLGPTDVVEKGVYSISLIYTPEDIVDILFKAGEVRASQRLMPIPLHLSYIFQQRGIGVLVICGLSNLQKCVD